MLWQGRWGYIVGHGALEGVAAPALTAPVNTVLPVISGTTTVGQTLTTTNGTWTGTPTPSYTYQWKRNGTNISGATSNSYLLVTADGAATITVTVTATNTAGSASATSTGVGPVGDQYWTSVKLLLGFEGADASTGSPGMTDESSAVHGTGTFHNQAQIDTAQFQFGASSLLLDGTTDWVTWPAHTDYNLSNLPFTIECWIRPTTVSGSHFICARWDSAGNFGWSFWQNNAQLCLNLSTTASDNIAQLAGGTLVANTWQAVCVDFDGAKYRAYINGAMVASSTTLRTVAASTNVLAVGASSISGSFGFAGWIDELRLTKATRYGSDAGYTVSTSAFPRS
jgi:hypothetical protein